MHTTVSKMRGIERGGMEEREKGGGERERVKGDQHNCSNTGIQLVDKIIGSSSPGWERGVEEDAEKICQSELIHAV